MVGKSNFMYNVTSAMSLPQKHLFSYSHVPKRLIVFLAGQRQALVFEVKLAIIHILFSLLDPVLILSLQCLVSFMRTYRIHAVGAHY